MIQRLLFLIADTGGGHRASANAVAAALNAAHPNRYDISIVDPFVEAAPSIAGATTGLYAPIARHVRWLWGGIYYATNSALAVEGVSRSILTLLTPGIRALIEEQKPAAIVSFHPLLNHVTGRILQAMPEDKRPPFLTVVTDFINLHPFWFSPESDAIVLPTTQALRGCIKHGIRPDRCHVLGLPIGPSFTAPPPDPKEKKLLRKDLGCLSSRPLVVVCGGADGAGKLMGITEELLHHEQPVDTVVICGRNEHLREELTNLEVPHDRTLIIQGFVTNMVDWLRAADVVVTKAGPGTVMEALCSGTPFVLCWYLPGQERGTVTWLRQHRVSLYSPNPRRVVNYISDVLSYSPTERQALLERIRTLATPHASSNIADLIESFISRSTAGTTNGS